MPENQTSYRQIIKATSIFGGVQVFNILIAIIRSKFISVLLGPAGMGIAGLLSSTTGLISGLTNFGLGVSAVKNVALANSTGNKTRIAIIITVLRRWVWLTGLLGMTLTIIAAPLLSQLTFGNSDYTFPFIWISVSLLLSQLSSGQIIVLQGMRQLKYLAKANFIGSISGLVLTLPLYYLFGIKGIVPAIIISSVVTLAGSWYFASKIKLEKITVSKVRTIAEGKEMLVMGFLISISSLISLLASYIIKAFISTTGSLEDVGLYAAGFLILNTYVGLIFKAMATDYYPRLSSVSSNNELCKETINQQAEIAILLLSPIILFFFVFVKWLILLLYSNSFFPVVNMVKWAALGMFFSGASWSIGFILLAKGDSKVFFWNELVANMYILAFNIIGYKMGGLTGLGISFLIGYVVYFIQIYVLCRIKYEFNFNKEFSSIFITQLFMATLCFLTMKYIDSPHSTILGIILFVGSLWYSLKKLENKIGIMNLLNTVKTRIIPTRK